MNRARFVFTGGAPWMCGDRLRIWAIPPGVTPNPAAAGVENNTDLAAILWGMAALITTPPAPGDFIAQEDDFNLLSEDLVDNLVTEF